MRYEVVVIDAPESPIEQPKEQKAFYSGKKKKHTLKTQVGLDQRTRRVIGV
jgi:hypothetical protein